MASSRVDDLILRWQNLRHQGREATPEAICAECPELLGEFRRRLNDPATLASNMAGGQPETADFVAPAGDAPPASTKDFLPRSRTDGKQRALPTVQGYEINEELGRGGMGVVYKARDLQLKRLVALKMILGGALANDEQIGRFRAEAEAVARLQHANIVQIYEIGEHDGLPFFSLEFVNGGSLSAFLAGTPQAARDAAHLVCTLARAMQVAHDAGIVHRDLKPGNILLSRRREQETGEPSPSLPLGSSSSVSESLRRPDNLQTVIPKVCDFGLAKQLDEQEGRTVSGAIMGTPSYMAPEQALGQIKKIGPLVDVYALGAILYEMLTGRPPFRGATPWETLDQVRTQDPVPPRQMQPRLPRDLETICLKCVHKESGRRYANAAALADDLQRFLNNEPVLARPIRRRERLVRWCQRRPAHAALVLGSIIVAATLLGLGFWFSIEMGAADARTLSANLDQERAENISKLEESKRRQAESLSATHAFYRTLNGVREKRQSNNEAGWTWRNLADLKKALHDFPAGKKLPEVYAEVAATLQSVDARQRLEIAPGFSTSALAFAPDGKSLALGQDLVAAWGALGGCQVVLVDPGTGKNQRTFDFPADFSWQLKTSKPDGVRSVAFSPDGSWLAAGSRSGQIHRWNLRDAKPKLHSWQAHSNAVEQVVFDRTSTALFSIAFHESMSRWRIADAHLEGTFKSDKLGTCFSYDPVSDHLIVQNGGVCEVRDAEFLFEVRGAMKGGTELVSYAPGGQVFFHVTDRRAEIYSALDDRPRRTLLLPHQTSTQLGDITAMEYGPSNNLLAIASIYTRHVQVWDLLNGQLGVTLPVGAGYLKLAFSPDGQTLAVSGEKATWLFELRRQQDYTAHALSAHPLNDLTISGNGAVFLSRDDAGQSSTWPIPGASAEGPVRPCKTFLRAAPFAKAALNDDGTRLAFRIDQSLLIWNMFSESTVQAQVDQDLTFWDPAQRLWTAQGSKVRLWKTPELKELGSWVNIWGNALSGRGTVTCLMAGKRWGLAGARDGVLHLFHGENARHVLTVPLGKTPISSLALMADESLAAIGTESGELFLVSIPEGKVLAQSGALSRQEHLWHLRPKRLESEEITGLHLLRADLVVSASRDRTVRFWRVTPSGLEEQFRLLCSGMVQRMQMTPDGRKLLLHIAGEHGIRCWHLDTLPQRFVDLGLEIDLASSEKKKTTPVSPVNPHELSDGPGLIRDEFLLHDLRQWTNARVDANIDFIFSKSGPGLPLGDQDFGIRWRGWLRASRPGTCVVRLQANDGARLWIDDKLVIDQWKGPATESQVEIGMTDQPKRFRLDYFQIKGEAHCHLQWAEKTDVSPLPFVAIPASAFFTSRAAALKAGR